MIAYDSKDCRIFAIALDKAWEIFLKTGRLTTRNIDVAKGALAYALLDAAQRGERNPRRLAMSAVARMSKFEGKLLFERTRNLNRDGQTDRHPSARAGAI